MRRTEGKRFLQTALVLSCHFAWFPPLLEVFSSHGPLHPLQFPSSMGCSALPASFWHQAEGLQGLPWSKHREREVAGFLKDEKGKKEGNPVRWLCRGWLLFQALEIKEFFLLDLKPIKGKFKHHTVRKVLFSSTIQNPEFKMKHKCLKFTLVLFAQLIMVCLFYCCDHTWRLLFVCFFSVL